jgi:hypothetical protein
MLSQVKISVLPLLLLVLEPLVLLLKLPLHGLLPQVLPPLQTN